MMKVRLLCTKHECDLSIDGPVLTAELQSDIDPSIRLGSPNNVHTGYYLFDLSRSWCNEAEGTNKDGFSTCQDYWRVVIYNA